MTVVPVAVRAVDSHGNPVTDLTVSDFELFENGMRQEIAQFSTRAYAKEAALAPRTFVFLLGFGNHEPSNGIKALVDFVRVGLLPSDRVSVAAFLRASEPTTDHAAVLQLLERYRARYLDIEQRIRADTRRIAGPMHPLSSKTVAAIAEVFAGSGSLRFHEFPGASGWKAQSFTDFGFFAQALQFVRLIPGEKHLIWLLEARRAFGKNGPAGLARVAAGAGTTISLITTGGSESAQPMSKGRVGQAYFGGARVQTVDMNKTIDSKALADLTGGIASFYANVGQQLTRVARITEFEYVLGYQPVNPPAEGEYRDIKVTLRRPGPQLYYRHGVQPRPTPTEDVDVRGIMTESRMLQATESDFRFTAIPLKLAIVPSQTASDGSITVDLEIDPKGVMFSPEGDKSVGTVDVILFVADAGGRMVAEHREQLELSERKLTRRRFTLKAAGTPDHVKAVAYDYESDRLGSASLRVRP